MKIKKVIYKEISVKFFVVIQSLSIVIQTIIMYLVSGIFTLFYLILGEFTFLENIFEPITDFIWVILFLQINLPDNLPYFSGSDILWFILWNIIGYGIVGYIFAKLRKKPLTIGYALISLIIIAAFYSLIGWLLIMLGILEWP